MTQPKPSHNWTSEDSNYLLRSLTDLRSHYNSLLATNYKESLKLVDMLNAARAKWLDESVENTQLRITNERLEHQNKEITNELRKINNTLRQTETQIATLLSAKSGLESELSAYKNRFEQLQLMLKEDQNEAGAIKLTRLNLFHLINSKESLSESCLPETSIGKNMVIENIGSSTLKTAENIPVKNKIDRIRADKQNIRDYKHQIENSLRKSKQVPVKRTREQFFDENTNQEEEFETDRMNEHPSTPKRSRGVKNISATTVITSDAEGKKPTKTKVTTLRSKRSMSESKIDERPPLRKTPISHAISIYNLHSPLPGFGNSWTNGQAIEQRQHNFKPFRSLIDSCDVCNKYLYLKNNALRCADCGLRFHADCFRPVPMPCLPRVGTPKTPKKQRPRLQDFCPNQYPMIPPLLIQCVIELESNRLNFEGIYRIPGSEVRVAQLLIGLKTSKVAPSLSSFDTETITGCIKKFLKELRDPLIPNTSWSEFVQAAEAESDDPLNNAILDLPTPNRDTLAYMCIHWQNVAKNSNVNRMPIENLALCLGPTVVGFSKEAILRMDVATGENKKQIQVMMKLLKMPQEYWKRFIEHNTVETPFESNISTLNSITPRSTRLRNRTQEANPSSSRGHIDFANDQSILGSVAKTPGTSDLSKTVHQRPVRNYINKQY
uniref:Rac GTPase-activating protein 1 n=1 Tax=Acrobeloides nanus TaxID=290746 RepID=A0A914CBB1_9BILA